MEPVNQFIFIGIDKEPEELKSDIKKGLVYITQFPFKNMGIIDVYSYNPDQAINIILEDIGTSESMSINSRKATLNDYYRELGD